MTIAPEALNLIKEFEGYLKRLNDGSDRVRPYLCPANVPTIGYGSIKYPNGRRVRLSDPPIGRQRALDLLAWEVEEVCEPAVDRQVKRPLHPLMRGAVVSFAFNCGTGALKRSTLLKRINAGRWEDVPRQFAKWRMGGGRVLRGLVRRRAAEARMFMRGVELMSDLVEPQGQPHASDGTPQPPQLPTRNPARHRSLWDRLVGIFWR